MRPPVICNRKIVAAGFALLVMASAACADDVVIDGTTATNVMTSPDGRIRVQIAPVTGGGVSLNRFQSFSVGKAGIELDNTSAGASLLINEVTGRSSTKIEGSLSVKGEKAHIIVANPNGISVDGGSFTGTRSVVLSTGKVEGGRLSVSSGSVSIGASGLKTDDAPVDIVSPDVLVDGSLETGSGDVSITTGTAGGEIDPNPEAATSISGLATSRAERGPSRIVVSSGAIINGGVIRLVALTPDALISSRGVVGASRFNLSSEGKVQLSGQVTASGAINVTGGQVSLGGSAPVKVASSGSGVRIRAKAGDVQIANSELSAVSRSTSDFSALGGVSIEASGKLTISSPQRNKIQVSADGLGLAAGDELLLSNVEGDAAGKLIATSSSAIALRDSHLKVGSANILASGSATLNSADIQATDGIAIDAAGVSIMDEGGVQSRVASENEGVTMISREDGIIISNSIIEAAARTTGDDASRGAVTLQSNAGILVSSDQKTTISKLTATTGGVNLDAVENIDILNGKLQVGGDLSIRAGGNFTSSTLVSGGSAVEREQTGNAVSGRNLTVRMDYGAPDIADFQTSLTASGAFQLEAANWTTTGAVIEADGVTARVAGDVINRSLVTGQAYFRRTCFFICSASGFSDVTLLEAKINSTGALNIYASGQVLNEGAILASSLDFAVTAPRFTAASILTPTVVLNGRGWLPFMGSRNGWIGYGYNGGFVGSFFGNVLIDAADISYSGVSIYAGQETSETSVPTIEDLPSGAGRLFDFHSGFLEAALR